MNKNPIVEKSYAFSLRIVKLYQYLCDVKKEYILSKQLMRCGTSIGANVAEAQRAQSRADFHAKMCIAQKEANETEYWIRLLTDAGYINEVENNSIMKDLKELLALLTSICKTSKTS